MILTDSEMPTLYMFVDDSLHALSEALKRLKALELFDKLNDTC